ncbi:MAG: NAD-dependent epimerase/dehydratase family protein [Paludibacter sp.]|nr:NAD-dependent epimerase/dehydratase family protein [Paludibacter sp.]
MKDLLLLYGFLIYAVKMKILVTGANGLLGHHVVMELLKRYYSVKIIVRKTQNIFFDLSSVEVCEGNFSNYQQLKTAAEGCDAIIHIAAVTDTKLMYYEDYSKINVDSTAQILKIANELNIEKLVYVSSSNTIGFGTEQQLADERFDIQFPFSKSFYAQSKVESEKLVVDASKKENRHFVIINPTFMIGAFDPKPSSGKLMLMGYKRRLMFAPKGGKNFVAVQDVAAAVCNALTQGKNGERYLASGVNLSFKEFYNLQKKIVGYKQYTIEIPDFLLSVIGKTGDLWRKAGIKTDICSINLNQLKIREYYSNIKAKTELDLPETELKTVIKEAIEWFKKHNMI